MSQSKSFFFLIQSMAIVNYLLSHNYIQQLIEYSDINWNKEVFITWVVMKVGLIIMVMMLCQGELSMEAPSQQHSVEWAFGGTHAYFL